MCPCFSREKLRFKRKGMIMKEKRLLDQVRDKIRSRHGIVLTAKNAKNEVLFNLTLRPLRLCDEKQNHHDPYTCIE